MTHPARPILAALLACTLAAPAAAQLKAPAGKPEPAAAATAPAAPGGTAAPAPGTEEKAQAAKAAANGWLVLLDRRDWGTAWEASATMFRQTVPLGAWMDGIPKVREPLGTFVERNADDAVYRTKLEGRPDGEYVTVVYTTRFDKEQVQETVTTVREADGRWRVTGYSAGR